WRCSSSGDDAGDLGAGASGGGATGGTAGTGGGSTACDQVCGAAEVCSLGRCASDCAAGLVACERACVDTRSDPAHCGGCGQGCSAGYACEEGVCKENSTPQ